MVFETPIDILLLFCFAWLVEPEMTEFFGLTYQGKEGYCV
jgi:hypothetical protein